MPNKNLYIIAGCNGAGKTTASYGILPALLNCKEFVNADEIARGLSPFQPETVSFEAGRIMLQRIDELLKKDTDFAFETTLATRSFKSLIATAHEKGYATNLLFFWLRHVGLAKARVAQRVLEGGHNIPEQVIERRYERGLKNLFDLYLPICTNVMVFENSTNVPSLVFQKTGNEPIDILDQTLFEKLNDRYKGN